ncbi:DevR family CRISPR-associated autoregulator [Clostridium thermosuccinogenes]|nr:DevR family CRISPR-associated autoregulator [Pseudoclostridium thermosuccinogenes]
MMNKDSKKMKISSISISGKITLDMHSLNNEGGEGNQILTRQVTIVDDKGKIHTVNAISGDMLKHVQTEHLYNIAVEKGLPLCNACTTFNSNRISGDRVFSEESKGKDQQTVMDLLLEKCVIDDMQGILVTNNNSNLPRKSCSEYGWLIGLPDKTTTENYFHVKLVPNAGSKSEGEDESSNQGQNIFHRPANSGEYALVCNLDIYRIGYNEITRTYSIDDNDRLERYKALLESTLYTFLKTKGAMRNTQNPHVVNFEGVLAISKNATPAPLISAINPDYKEEIERIADALNSLDIKEEPENNEKNIVLRRFNSLSEFADAMKDLINEGEPYKVKESRQEG